MCKVAWVACGTVQNEKIVLLRDFERLLDAAILFNGDVRLQAALQSAAAPVETCRLGHVQVGNFHLPVLCGELPCHQPGKRAFPDPAFLRDNSHDHGHRAPSFVHCRHASMLTCKLVSMPEC